LYCIATPRLYRWPFPLCMYIYIYIYIYIACWCIYTYVNYRYTYSSICTPICIFIYTYVLLWITGDPPHYARIYVYIYIHLTCWGIYTYVCKIHINILLYELLYKFIHAYTFLLFTGGPPHYARIYICIYVCIYIQRYDV
jgi:hypothetical protein